MWHADPLQRPIYWPISFRRMEAYWAFCAGRPTQTGSLEFPCPMAWSQNKDWDPTFRDRLHCETEHVAHRKFTWELANGRRKCLEGAILQSQFYISGHCWSHAGPKDNSIMQICGEEVPYPISLDQLEGILLYAPGKGQYRMPLSQFMDLLYREGDMSAATAQQRLLYVRRNQAAEMRKQISGLRHELVNPFADLIATKLWTFLLLKVMECCSSTLTICS